MIRFLIPLAALGGIIYYGREKSKKESEESAILEATERAYEDAMANPFGRSNAKGDDDE